MSAKPKPKPGAQPRPKPRPGYTEIAAIASLNLSYHNKVLKLLDLPR